ncbi:50S ribosomal protein L18 [Candidatus Woesearchaeota archaeon]|nr:50S ribosomal protein L18 [Candidatus Woesearchaeota archaeon]
MRNHKTRTVAHRRKREGKTDYRRRLKILLSGKPRLVIRKSLKEITAQLITYVDKGDKVLTTVRSGSLKKYGWLYNYRNLSSAYLLGMLIAKKAKELKINEAILDIGLHKSVPGSRIYAVLKGAVDNGLKIPHSKDVLPVEERITGKHIEEYAKKLSPEDLQKRFGDCMKKGADPLKISSTFNDIKNKISGAA